MTPLQAAVTVITGMLSVVSAVVVAALARRQSVRDKLELENSRLAVEREKLLAAEAAGKSNVAQAVETGRVELAKAVETGRVELAKAEIQADESTHERNTRRIAALEADRDAAHNRMSLALEESARRCAAEMEDLQALVAQEKSARLTEARRCTQRLSDMKRQISSLRSAISEPPKRPRPRG